MPSCNLACNKRETTAAPENLRRALSWKGNGGNVTHSAGGSSGKALQLRGNCRDHGFPRTVRLLPVDFHGGIPWHSIAGEAVAPLRHARRHHPHRAAERAA